MKMYFLTILLYFFNVPFATSDSSISNIYADHEKYLVRIAQVNPPLAWGEDDPIELSDAKHGLGVDALNHVSYEEAIRYFTDAIATLETDLYYFSRGRAYLEIADLHLDKNLEYAEEQALLALRDFDKSIEINPNNPKFAKVYGFRGVLNQRLENIEQAIEDLTKFRRLDRTEFFKHRIYRQKLKQAQQAKRQREGKRTLLGKCLSAFSFLGQKN